VEESHFDGQVAATGLDNYIGVRHDDGTAALYGHITREGATVSVGGGGRARPSPIRPACSRGGRTARSGPDEGNSFRNEFPPKANTIRVRRTISTMEVEVPLGGSRWPVSCPCCGGRADGRLELSGSRGVFLVVAAAETVVKVQVPYCQTCVRHARAFEKGTVGRLLYPAALVLAGSFFAGVIALAVNGGGSDAFLMAMLLHMPAAVTALFVAARVIGRSRAAVGAPHVSTAPVLRIESWTEDSVTLECANASYALALREANGR
jgi:hypothetical protein